MKAIRPRLLACVVPACLSAWALTQPAHADDLFQPNGFSSLAADRVASSIGDTLTVVVVQTAEARNSAASRSDGAVDVDANISGGSTSEGFAITFGRDAGRQGEVRRSHSFTAQIAVTVIGIADNGDLLVQGSQSMLVNGEATTLRVTGRVRRADIRSDNRVLSTEVADATIAFDSVERLDQRQQNGILRWLGNWFRGVL